MKLYNLTPEHAKIVARELFDIGFTSAKYEKEVQNKRRERLRFWYERGINVLIEHEQELIDYGNHVHKHLIDFEVMTGRQ